MHEQLVTLQRQRKLEIVSYDPFNNKNIDASNKQKDKYETKTQMK